MVLCGNWQGWGNCLLWLTCAVTKRVYLIFLTQGCHIGSAWLDCDIWLNLDALGG